MSNVILPFCSLIASRSAYAPLSPQEQTPSKILALTQEWSFIPMAQRTHFLMQIARPITPTLDPIRVSQQVEQHGVITSMMQTPRTRDIHRQALCTWQLNRDSWREAILTAHSIEHPEKQAHALHAVICHLLKNPELDPDVQQTAINITLTIPSISSRGTILTILFELFLAEQKIPLVLQVLEAIPNSQQKSQLTERLILQLIHDGNLQLSLHLVVQLSPPSAGAPFFAAIAILDPSQLPEILRLILMIHDSQERLICLTSLANDFALRDSSELFQQFIQSLSENIETHTCVSGIFMILLLQHRLEEASLVLEQVTDPDWQRVLNEIRTQYEHYETCLDNNRIDLLIEEAATLRKEYLEILVHAFVRRNLIEDAVTAVEGDENGYQYIANALLWQLQYPETQPQLFYEEKKESTSIT